MPLRLTQVDAFTDRPYQGNPAAVCVLGRDFATEWMQLVAREMNLSETAFATPGPDGVFGLRWFTPTVEVDLCGHATLATAHVLWDEGHASTDEPLRFRTLSGILTARRLEAGIALDFPAEAPAPCPVPEGLSETLGSRPVATARNRMDLLVELESAEAVRNARPDFGRLAADPARGVIITARSDDPSFDFISRFFAPRIGVDEDPVCGSAHCALGPYWGERLGKDRLVGYQASARGGIVGVNLGSAGRLELLGQAVSVLRSELLWDPE
jgi:PhzF family phenazine biosynthesis protein